LHDAEQAFLTETGRWLVKNFLTLEGKSIIITGASSGIGRQCAITASQIGATVALIGRDAQRLNETYSLMEPGNHLKVSFDITNYELIDTMIASIVNKIGKINGFIHSAGIEIIKPILAMKAEDYEKLFAINVISGFEIAKIISHKKNLSPQGASFIYLSSVMGILGETGRVAYCASKGALIAAVKAMALELIPKNVRVNCLLPGIVETPMVKNLLDSLLDESKQAIIDKHPLGLGKPEDIAYWCAFLLSDLSRWVTGSSLVIDGGYSAV
jgi:NAD(P)-dependent dehydrogenase (short-subunit alcohol dehydrogenase family)